MMRGGAPRTAAEVRSEKMQAREATKPDAPPKMRGLDEVLAALGELKIAEEMHAQGLLDPQTSTETAARPKPRAVAQPTASPQEETVDRTPPAPAKQAQSDDAAVKPPAGKPAGLDDLFGGGPQEGRVRIGKRTRPKKDTDD